jgi:hypothetical protein
MHRVGHPAPTGPVGGDRRVLLVGILAIHLAKAPQILHRDDGPNLATMAGEHDPLATNGNMGKNVRKAFTHG